MIVLEYVRNKPIRIFAPRANAPLEWEGVGEGYQFDEVVEQEMDKLQFLVVDTCELFIALTVALNF